MANEGPVHASAWLDVAKPGRSRRPALLVSVLLVMLASWIGVLDKASVNYVDGALVKATVAFATARAINGAISVAQSTTVSVGVGAGVQVSPGELLDPINDLVEDYSSAMKLAIASLVIQKILLSVVSETVFKVLLTLSGIALAACLLVKTAPVNFLFRVFVSLAFLRFILVGVVLLNGLVNHAFINQRTNEAMDRLNVLPGELGQATGIDLAARNTPPVEDLATIERELSVAREAFQQSTSQLDAARARVGLAGRLNPFREDQAYEAAATAVEEHEARLHTLLVERCDALRQAGDASADAACEEVPLAAKAKTLVASAGSAISGAVKTAAAAVDFSGLRQRVESAAIDMVTAMALFVLQTMILPLLFLLALSKATTLIWGINLKAMVTGKQEPSGPAQAEPLRG